MGMNTNNLMLSSTSTKQLERMIHDAAWITYPLHMLVGILKMFVFVGLCILAVFISITVWLMNAHDNRAEWTKNFATEQSTYRVSFVNKTAHKMLKMLDGAVTGVHEMFQTMASIQHELAGQGW
jgi:hypothetical protein